ncbi:MAG TPA: Wzz/FepE/Etk N-terminal domain-containing protein [Xanthobacteraceae bacterium]|nr:Wzz/FepE/Etk N-terminal domain-containing protein [Xanthobacteraceae bacterium]
MSVASPPPRAQGPSDAELDLSALGATLWRKKWTVLRPTILVAVATLVIVQFITPRYQAESRVFIESRDNIYLRPDVVKDALQNPVDDEAVTSQVQIILSRDLAREVINKLKLGDKPEFDSARNGVSPIASVLGLLGLVKDPLSMTPEERVLNAYYDRLTVTPVEKSRVINIDFLSQNPELAAQVANTIADAYLMRQREAKEEQAKTASQWLSGEIDTMRKRVEESDAKVEAFRAKANLLVGNNNTTLSAQTLGDVNAQLAAARAQKADAEAKAKLIRDMLRSGQPIESSDILNSELIRRLSEQRVTLRAQLAEQSATLLGNHPRIIELKAQIADLDKQIRAEAETVARSFENDAKLAGARVDTLTASLDQLKNQAATTNGQDVQLRALERDAKSQRDLLESYLAKYREAASRNSLESSPADARVISRATVSNVPAYPKKLPTVLIATFATFLISSGLVMTKEILAAPFGPVPARTEPAIGMSDALAPRLAAIANERAPAAGGIPAGSIASVADNLRQAGAAGERLAVFGAVPGMNTSQTAIKLARLLADDSRVVLVGLASGDTAIRGISNEPTAPGLAELAAGVASFGGIITKDKFSPLHLISAGQAPVDRVGILAAPGVVASFNALARAYDHVVIDAGEAAGAEIERISEIGPHVVLITDAPSNAATTSARDRLMAAGFDDVRILVGGYGTETAAAA